MIVKFFWNNTIPDGAHTSDELITVPEDSPSIQELFERAARGESLGGTYDEFDEDSEIVDRVHDPDLQDPLLREAMLNNDLETAKRGIGDISKKSQRSKTASKNTSASKQVDNSESSGTKEDKTGTSSDN